MHNTLFESDDKYRSMVESGTAWNEILAYEIMRKAAPNSVIVKYRLPHIQSAMHIVMLQDGLGGSLEAGRRHVDGVRAEADLHARAWRAADDKAILDSLNPSDRELLQGLLDKYPDVSAKEMMEMLNEDDDET